MTEDNFDMRPHNDTWDGFCKLMKWSSIFVALLLIIMAATLV